MRLGEVGDVKMCKRIFNDETSPAGEIPFFKIGSFGKVADAFISRELYLDYRKRFSFPKKGDILISAAGTIGRTVVYEGEDAYYQDSNIVWIDNDNTKVSNKFLFYVLGIVKYNTEGGTIQRLYNNILKSTEFSSPSILEQSKIANFLSLIDTRIQTQSKIIDYLKTLKNTVEKKIFTQQLRFKDDNRNDYPEWEEMKLGEVCLSIASGKDKIEDKGIFNLYGSTGIIGKTNNASYNGNYILIARVGANAGYLNKVNEKFGVTDNALVISLDNFQNVDFIYYALGNFGFNKLIFGSGQPLITGGQLKNIVLSFPSLQEQQKIANFLSSIDSKIDIEVQLLRKLEEQKKFLLQNLFI